MCVCVCVFMQAHVVAAVVLPQVPEPAAEESHEHKGQPLHCCIHPSIHSQTSLKAFHCVCVCVCVCVWQNTRRRKKKLAAVDEQAMAKVQAKFGDDPETPPEDVQVRETPARSTQFGDVSLAHP